MQKLERAALTIFSGCLLVMAAVVVYGMMKDKEEPEEDYFF